MLRSKWKLHWFAICLIGILNRNVCAQDDPAGVVESISNIFKGGPAGDEAQRQLIQICGKATFILALLFFCYIAASAVGRFIGGTVTRKVDVTLGKFLSKAIRNIIMLVVAMISLEVVADVNIAGFAAILAAAGFAVGMALQGTLGNFAAGVMLLIFRPFKVDDYIVVTDTEGTVEEIDLFTTRLNSLDNRHVIIPNGEIFGAKLENYTRNPVRRVDVNVGAAYSADIKETRAVLERAAARIGTAYGQSSEDASNPNPQVYLQKLGASSVDWQLRVWCHPSQYWDVREELTAAAKDALDRAGISIPFPQLDVHVLGKVMAKAA